MGIFKVLFFGNGKKHRKSKLSRKILDLRPKQFVFRITWKNVPIFLKTHAGLVVIILSLMTIGFFVTRPFFIKASVATFYPINCLGGWENIHNAEGEPQVSNNDSKLFNEQNSAYLNNRISQIYCGNFKGALPQDTKPEKVTLHLSWAVGQKDNTAAQKTDATSTDVVFIDLNEDFSSSVQNVGNPLLNATSTLPSIDSAPVPETPVPTPTPASVSVPESSELPAEIPAPTPELTPPASDWVPVETPASPTSFLNFLFPKAHASAIATTGSTMSISETATSSTTVVASPEPAPAEDPIFTIFYTLDGKTWNSLGGVTRAEIGKKDFEIPIDNIQNQTDLSNIQINIQSATTLDQDLSVYLDGMSLLVQYENSVTQITQTETDTNTGKLVTVSATNEDPSHPVVDVLASTKIPKIFKVGEESKIHIKWKNNGNQAVESHAYDKDGDGYLDYVEWTVPHLSEQTFEIIFISKAFRLDENKQITEDIYSQVQSQDGVWATAADGQYVRFTFASPVGRTKNIDIYTKPTDANSPATIEVYPVYTDADGNQTEGPMVASVQIDHEDYFHPSMANLGDNPTDVFDFKIVGGVDIDYVQDGTTYTAVAAGGDWNTNSTWSPSTGHPVAGDIAIIDGSIGNGNITVGTAAAAAVITFQNGYTGTFTLNADMTTTGNVTLLSTMTFTPNSQTWNMGAASDILTTGGKSFYNLNFNVAGTITLADTLNISNTLSTSVAVTIATSDINCYGLTLTSSTAAINGTGRTINLKGGTWSDSAVFIYGITTNLTITGTVTVSGNVTYGGQTLNSTGATLTFTNTPQLWIISSCTFTDATNTWVTIYDRATATLTLSQTTTISGNLVTAAGNSLTLASHDIIVGGNLATGSSTAGITGQTITMTGASGSATWSSGALTAGYGIRSNLIFLGGANTITVSGNVYFGCSAFGSGIPTLTYTSGTMALSGSTLNIAGNMTLTDATNTWVNISSSYTTPLTLTLSQSTSISGNLTVSGSGGGLTLASNNLSVGGTLAVSAGTLNIATYNVAVTGAVQITGGTISGSSGVLIGGSFDVQAGTISAILGGTGIALTKTTSGTVTLSGANTYTGLTTISAGTLTISGDESAASGGVTLTAGALHVNSATALGTGTLTINGGTIDNSSAGGAIVNSKNNVQVWGGNFSNTCTSYGLDLGTGAVTMNGNIQLTLGCANFTVGGAVGDGGHGYTLTKAGGGALTLSSANTYTGLTTISAGTLYLNGDNTAASGGVTSGGTLVVGSATALGTGTLTINGGAIRTNNASPLTNLKNNVQVWNANFVSACGSNTLDIGTGAVTLGANVQMNITCAGFTVGGAIGDGGNGYTLTKIGSAAVILNGNNTYTGLTTTSAGTLTLAGDNTAASGGVTLTAGTLNVGSATALGTGTLTINGGTLSTSGGVSITNTQNNIQVWNGNFTFLGSQSLNLGTGAVTLGGNIQVTTAAYAFTVGGAIGDGGHAYTLTKPGAGPLILSGVNTYTGDTTISAGTIRLSNANALASSTVVVSSTNGLTFGTGIGAFNVGGLSGASNFALADIGLVAVTLQAGGNNTSTTYSGIMSGTSGALTKQGSGTLILSGVNTYTGVTTINAGTFSVATIGNGGVAGNLGQATNVAGNLVLGGGTLTYAGSTASTDRAFTLTAGTTSTISVTTNTLTISGAGAATNGALTKAGGGTLILSGNNTYTGLTTISAGPLTISGDESACSGGVTLTAGTLNVNSATALGTGTFTINGGTLGVGSGLTITNTQNNLQSWNGDFTFAIVNASLNLGTGAVTLSANRVITIGSGGSSWLIIGGAIGDGGSGYTLTKAGAGGTLFLNGNNTYTGLTTLSGGSLTLAGDNTAATGGVTITAGTLNINSDTALGTGTFTINGGTIGRSSAGTTNNSKNNVQIWNGDFSYPSSNNSLNLGTGAVTMNGNRTITTLGGGGGIFTVGGAIGDGGNGYSLTKAGVAEPLVLNGANTYTGLTTVSAGTLTLAGDNTAASGGVTLTAGTLNINSATALGTGTFTINGGAIVNPTASDIVLSTNNPMNWNGNFGFGTGHAIDFGNGNVTMNNNITLSGCNQAMTVRGAIGDGGNGYGLTQTGCPGTYLYLYGTSTYTGATAIQGGVIYVSNLSALGNATSPVVLATASSVGSFSYSGTSNTWTRGFTVNAAGGSITSSASGQTLTIQTGGIAMNGNLTLGGGITISSIISGAGNLSSMQSGGAITTLSGLNTYTGTTTIVAGKLYIGLDAPSGSPGALGNATSDVVCSTSAYGCTIYTVGPYTVGRNIAVGSQGTKNLGGNTADISTFSGNIALSGNVTLTASAGGSSVFSGNITGGYAITISGAGIVTLSGANNTYSAGTTLSGGTININSATALGTGTFTNSGYTIDNTSGNAITLSNNNAQAWNSNFTFTGTNDLNFGTGAVTLGGTYTATVNGHNLTVGGVISGSYGLYKAGTGTLTLTGNNTYTGITKVKAGTLSFNKIAAVGGGASALGAPTTVANGTITLSESGAATLSYTGSGHSSDRVITLGGASTIDASGAGTLTLSGGVTGGTYNLALTGSGNGAENGAITTTSGTLTKTGAGTWTLGGTNTYTGATTVSAGTLQNGVADSFKSATTTISSGATLDLSAYNLTLAGSTSFANNGTLKLYGDQTVTNAPTNGAGSTVEYNAVSGSRAIKSWTYTNTILKINGAGTFTLPGSITTAGINIATGILDASPDGGTHNYNITDSGNWANTGTFTPRAGTVTFNGTGAQSISGSNTWYGLSATTTSARTVSFESGKTQTIADNGSLTLQGSSGNLLSLVPITPASAWKLAVSTTGVTQNITYAAPSYSDASGVTNFNQVVNGAGVGNVDDSTNINWSFGTVTCSVDQSSTSFGTLDSGVVNTSSVTASTTMTCSFPGGCTMFVQDSGNSTTTPGSPGLYAATATGTPLILSSTATLSAGTEGYGIQAATTTAGSGATLILSNTYFKSGNDIGGLTTVATAIASSTAAVTGREVVVTHKAAISPLTLPGDYNDTITYSCVGN